MATGDFFSSMMGFNAKYTEATKVQNEDESYYEDVDFCQGAEAANNDMFIFGKEDENSYNSYSDDDCLFNFEFEENDNIG